MKRITTILMMAALFASITNVSGQSGGTKSATGHGHGSVSQGSKLKYESGNIVLEKAENPYKYCHRV
jgi:hypothetical protein